MSKTYEDGLRDGQIKNHEDQLLSHGKRLDTHNGRISTLEKAMYGVMLIVVFIEFFPQLKAFFGG